MVVQPAYRRIVKQHAPATIGLQPVLMRIDHDRGGFAHELEREPRFVREVVGEHEVPAVRRVRVDSEVEAAAHVDDGRKWIHGAGRRRPHRRHDSADAARREPALERRDVHSSGAIARNRFEGQAEHAGDPLVRVMRLRRSDDGLAGMQLAGNPQRLEVRHRPAAAEMPQVNVPPDHLRERRDGFFLHRRAGAAAVERVVVGIDLERHLVGAAGDRVRRLEHLPRVQRIAIWIVVLEAFRDFLQHRVKTLQGPSNTSGPTRRECFRAASTVRARTRAS